MIKSIFYYVAESLFLTGQRIGLTYNEVNILTYYLLIPLTWSVMIDVLIGMPITTMILTCIWIGIFIAQRNNFRSWCDSIFQKSVNFLNWFNRWGGNYILNSVIICVIIPIIIYILLIFLLING